jgi:ribosomal protein L18
MSEKKSIGTSQAVLKKLGETFAATLKKLKLDGFYLDRGHRLYRGKLAAFTDALRQKGIQI